MRARIGSGDQEAVAIPDEVHAAVRDDALLVDAADALRTGLLPADLRAALYGALGRIPALKVTEQAANLDGRVGWPTG